MVESTRRILAMDVAQMPAKGLLAKISRKEYHSSILMRETKSSKGPFKVRDLTDQSDSRDQNPMSTQGIRVRSGVLPLCWGTGFKGRRACVTGQGA